MPKQPETIRTVAWEILNQVSEKSLWAENSLERYLKNSTFSQLDQRLCRELVYGTLKNRYALDYQLDPLFKSPKKPKNNVLNLLRLGMYQLLYLDRIPDHAALNETVNCAKKQLPKALQGFINAILRSAKRRGLLPWPDDKKNPVVYLATRYSMPNYLVKRWLGRYGFLKAEAFFKSVNLVPPMVLRINLLKISRNELIAGFEEKGITCTAGILEETLFIQTSDVKPGDLPGFDKGWFYFQDQSSQMVAHIVAPKSGRTCLDLCAAPGGKTTHLAERMGDKGIVFAFDIKDVKRQRIRENVSRLQLKTVNVIDKIDNFTQADYLLVDAPCSGIGTMRRHVETKWRVQENDFKKMALGQLELLEQASTLLKSGGTLVYSTCTTEPEENEDVVNIFLENHPEFVLNPQRSQQDSLLARFWRPDGFFRTFPDYPEMDGIFAARLKKLDI